MIDQLLTRLATCDQLNIENGHWHLDDLRIPTEEVFDVWDNVMNTLQTSDTPIAIKRIILWEDPHDESYAFMLDMDQLEDLIFYDTMSTDDLSELNAHPSLRRVVFADYIGLYTPDDFAWLNTLPCLEELIYMTNYIDLRNPALAPSTWQRLRALWTTLRTFGELNGEHLRGLERLTLRFHPDDVIEIDNEPSLEASKQQMLARFDALATGHPCSLRLIYDGSESFREQTHAILNQWIPKPIKVTWADNEGTLLNNATFLNARPLFEP